MARWSRTRRARFSHRLEAMGIRMLLSGCSAIGHGAALRVGIGAGELAWRLGIRRKVVEEGITLADGLPDDPDTVRDLGRAVYRNLGCTVAEYARLPRHREALLRDHVRVEGADAITEGLAAGRGVMAMSGHFGALEVMAAAVARPDVESHVLVAPMRNPMANDLFDRHRREAGLTPIEVGPGMRRAVRVLREGKLLCVAADQDAGRHGVFIDFLGRPASTPPGLIELALRTGARMVFGVIVRDRPEGPDHTVRLEGPYELTPQGTHDETVRHYLEFFSNRLAVEIRRHPEQWFWLHRRWKTMPPA